MLAIVAYIEPTTTYAPFWAANRWLFGSMRKYPPRITSMADLSYRMDYEYGGYVRTTFGDIVFDMSLTENFDTAGVTLYTLDTDTEVLTELLRGTIRFSSYDVATNNNTYSFWESNIANIDATFASDGFVISEYTNTVSLDDVFSLCASELGFSYSIDSAGDSSIHGPKYFVRAAYKEGESVLHFLSRVAAPYGYAFTVEGLGNPTPNIRFFRVTHWQSTTFREYGRKPIHAGISKSYPVKDITARCVQVIPSVVEDDVAPTTNTISNNVTADGFGRELSLPVFTHSTHVIERGLLAIKAMLNRPWWHITVMISDGIPDLGEDVSFIFIVDGVTRYLRVTGYTININEGTVTIDGTYLSVGAYNPTEPYSVDPWAVPLPAGLPTEMDTLTEVWPNPGATVTTSSPKLRFPYVAFADSFAMLIYSNAAPGGEPPSSMSVVYGATSELRRSGDAYVWDKCPALPSHPDVDYHWQPLLFSSLSSTWTYTPPASELLNLYFNVNAS